MRRFLALLLIMATPVLSQAQGIEFRHELTPLPPQGSTLDIPMTKIVVMGKDTEYVSNIRQRTRKNPYPSWIRNSLVGLRPNGTKVIEVARESTLVKHNDERRTNYIAIYDNGGTRLTQYQIDETTARRMEMFLHQASAMCPVEIELDGTTWTVKSVTSKCPILSDVAPQTDAG